jgi:DNA primase
VIPEDVIAEIKQRADIGAVVGRSVKLKKQGKNLIGLCPFHTEKSPSFSVRPDEGYFYCFGCRAAGDVVEFLVKSTGRGFLDVLTELAAETGVAIPERVISSEESAAQKEKKRLLKVTELAQVFFRTRLASDEGRLARAYLSDSRALDDATIDGFGLGFGGASDRGLKEFLVGQGFSVDDGVKAGVLGRGERGEYDFFRQRITIPIRSARGETLSFGGRIFGAFAEPRTLPDGTTRTPPKYLNGPQTPIYDKANTLYGLYEAQPALKQGKPAILVEGYFDVIAVFRAGLQTAVAPCGTSLTSRHIEELQRRVGEGGRVVVCLDSDRAGLEAAHTAILMLLQAGLDAGFVALPEKDPDQLVKDGRTDELKSLLLAAPGALEALIDTARTKASGGIQQRVAAIDAVLPFLAAPSRQLVRQEAIRATARAFGDDEQTIAKEVEQKGRRLLASRLRGDKQLQAPRAKSSSSSTSPPSSSSSSSTSAARPPARAKKPAGPPLSDLEVQVAKIVLCHPELAPRVALLMLHLDNLELRGFVERLLDALVRFFDLPPREALAKVPVRREGQLVALADRVRLDGPDRVIGLATAISMVEAMSRDFLERQVLEARLGSLQPLLAAADADDNHGERKRLLAEQRALVAALQALDRPPGAPLASLGVVAAPALVSSSSRSLPPALSSPERSPPAVLPSTAAVAPPMAAAAAPPTVEAVELDPPWGGDDEDPWVT